jgi:hypothetical protein
MWAAELLGAEGYDTIHFLSSPALPLANVGVVYRGRNFSSTYVRKHLIRTSPHGQDFYERVCPILNFSERIKQGEGGWENAANVAASDSC